MMALSTNQNVRLVIVVPSTHLGNLRSHLKRKHPEVFQSVNATETENIEPPRQKRKVTVEYEREEVLDAWIDLVTVEGRPFRLLDSNALRKLVKPVFDALDADCLTSQTVGEAIRQRAEKKRDEIRALLDKKMIHLKIDAATRHRRRVVGINAQLIIGDQIVVKTLSAEDMKRRHTASNIKEHVLNVLERFKIDLIQVYSVTQDNGKNFVSAANMMTYLESPEFDLSFDDDDEYDDDNDNNDDLDLNELVLIGVQVIRCVAHTLNLAVEDTFEESILKVLLKKVRALAQHLRTPVIAELLRAEKLTEAKMDKYDMVLSVKRLKDFCESQNITMLTDADWEEIDTFLDVFKPTKIASKRFQHTQLCIGDFFKHWLDLTLKVKELSGSASTKKFAEPLLKHLMVRERFIFGDNPNLNAALYLDPRFRKVFEQIRPEFFNVADARKHLLKVYRQLNNVEKRNNDLHELESTSESNSSSSSEFNVASSSTSQNSDVASDVNPLETFLNSLYDEPDAVHHSPDDDEQIIAAEAIIRDYDDKQPLDTNPLYYWYDKRYSHPILYQLAMVVHGVPATQVSVERCFSVLRFVFNDYRTRLSPEG